MPWYNHAATFADPDTGAFSEDFKGIVGNFSALARGDSGAPKIARPISGGNGATITFTGLNAFSGAVADIYFKVGAGPGSTTVNVLFSDDGATFYGSTSLFSSLNFDALQIMKFWVDFPSGEYGCTKSGDNTIFSSGIISGVSDTVVAIRFSVGGSTAAISLEPNGGII